MEASITSGTFSRTYPHNKGLFIMSHPTGPLNLLTIPLGAAYRFDIDGKMLGHVERIELDGRMLFLVHTSHKPLWVAASGDVDCVAHMGDQKVHFHMSSNIAHELVVGHTIVMESEAAMHNSMSVELVHAHQMDRLHQAQRR